MIDTHCSQCQKPMQIAETPLESGDRYWTIQFRYKTFFFCSQKHADRYAE